MRGRGGYSTLFCWVWRIAKGRLIAWESNSLKDSVSLWQLVIRDPWPTAVALPDVANQKPDTWDKSLLDNDL